MRLPDLGDRELVGRAANLNESQITELARLPRGVAAVYQNEWIEPVLCKVARADKPEQQYVYEAPEQGEPERDEEAVDMIAELLSGGKPVDNADFESIRLKLDQLIDEPFLRVSALKMLESGSKKPKMTKLAPIMGALFPEVKRAVARACSESSDEPKWTEAAEEELAKLPGRTLTDQARRDVIQAIVTDHLINEAHDEKALEDWASRGGLR